MDEKTLFGTESSNNKDLSMQDIFGDDTSTEEFLEERGFAQLLQGANHDTKESLKKVLLSGEHRLKEKFTLPKMMNQEIKGVVRSNSALQQIDNLLALIQENNTRIKEFLELIDIGFSLKASLTFNSTLEGKFDYNHVAFDTEANTKSQTVLNTAINYEAKRIVSAYYDPNDPNLSYTIWKTKENWHVIRLRNQNLWGANLVADYENTLGTIMISALMQGHEDLISIYNQVAAVKIPLNRDLLIDILLNIRKSLWICHNNGYDIPKLNALHKPKRGQRTPFGVVKDFELEFIEIKKNQFEGYKLKCGNTKAGFRFAANSNTRFNWKGMPYITLAPYQASSFSNVYGVDTLILAEAGRFKKLSLEALSKDLPYPKIQLDEEKNFTPEDMQLVNGNQISDKWRYNIMDCMATLSVYAMLTDHLDISEIAQELQIPLFTNTNVPFATKIYSSSSFPKKLILADLSHKLGLSEKEIIDNLKRSREHFKNFRTTFMGGAADCEVAKHVESDDFTIEELIESYTLWLKEGILNDFALHKKLIAYLDFRNQYPHAAWLIHAELKLQLAAQGKLQNYLNNDVDQIRSNFWRTIIQRLKQPLELFDKNFFQPLDGNATVEIDPSLDLQFRRTHNTKKTEVIIKGSSTITCHLTDLAISVLQYLFTHPGQKIKHKIKFLKAECMDLPEVGERGSEFFTKLFNIRMKFERKYGKHHSKPQLCKFIGNTAFGITAEGNSKDYEGVFQLYCVSSSITGVSRFLTKYAKLMYKHHGALNLNNDTDGFQALTTIETHEKIRTIFDDIMPLEYEEDVAFDRIDGVNIQYIPDGYYLGKKKYGLKYWNGAKYQIYAKKHGIGSHAGDIDPFFQGMYSLLFQKKSPSEIVSHLLPDFKYWSQLTYKKDKDGRIRGIKALKRPELYRGSYHWNDLEILIYEQPKTKIFICQTCDKEHPKLKTIVLKKYLRTVLDIHSANGKKKIYRKKHKQITPCCEAEYKTKLIPRRFLLTNVDTITKGTFGDYFIFQNVVFWICADIKGRFHELADDLIAQMSKDRILPFMVKPIKTNKTQQMWLDFLEGFEEVFARYDESEQEIEFSAFGELYQTYANNVSLANKMRVQFLKLIAKVFNVKTPINVEHFYEYLWDEIYFQELTTYTDFLTYLDQKMPLQRGVKWWKKGLSEIYDKNLIEQEYERIESSEYLTLLEELPEVRKRILQLCQYDNKYFSLDVKKSAKSLRTQTEYLIMEPIKLKKVIHDKSIDLRVDFNRQINVDGWNIGATCILPRLDFTTHLQARQTYFYSQSIQMFAYIYSRIYYETRHKNNYLKRKEKVEDLLTKKSEEYPIGKEGRDIVVPFRIRQYWSSIAYDQFIPESELLMSLTKKEIDYQVSKKHLEETYQSQIKGYLVKNPEKFLYKMKLIKAKGFWTGKWMNREFCFELVSKQKDPANINATLRIKVMVGESNLIRQLENFSFNAEIRVNPTSRGLYNLDLFNTTINEINKDTWIIKELILKAINYYSSHKDQILKFFTNKASLTVKDIKEKQAKDYALESTYMILCYTSLKKSLEHLRYNLRTLAITNNIHTNLTPDTLKILENQVFQITDQLRNNKTFESQNSNQIAELIRSLKLNKHSESEGFTFKNLANKSAIHTYIKNQRQFINKLARFTKNDKANLIKGIDRSKSIEFDETILRVEITMFSFSKILLKDYYDLLDLYTEFIHDCINDFNTEEMKKAIKPFKEFKNKFTPILEQILDKWLEIPNPEMLFLDPSSLEQELFMKDHPPPYIIP